MPLSQKREAITEAKRTAKPPEMPLRRSVRQQAQAIGRQTQAGSLTDPILIASSPPLSPHADEHLPPPSSPPGISSTIRFLPSKLPSKLPGLSNEGTKLLHYKQQCLKSPSSQAHRLQELCSPKSNEFEGLRNAVDATLVFAQEEAGTAVCISHDGLLLTCSHCVAESEEDLDMEKIWWLLFADGRIIQAKTVKWDRQLDLALLQITAAQSSSSIPTSSTTQLPLPQLFHSAFSHITLASTEPPNRSRLLCVGHPGSEDLEARRPGKTTGYDVLHISEGKLVGYAEGQDRLDNSEIGALMHDCWTYWGHSGAPLIERQCDKRKREGGRLVGLHSSWDDETAMRRGVGWEALKGFLG